MKAAVITGKEKLEIMELPMPQLGEDQVLIRNKFCAICNGTDTKLYKGIHGKTRYPAVIGHEGAGIVEKVGKNVKSIRPGDRVLGGSYPASENMGSIWGQYSEYGLQYEKDVIIIPDNVTLEQATCAHMLGEALNAIKIGEIRPGDDILIIGAGAVGSSLLTLLKHTFPNQIIVIDLIDEKLDFAKKLGADIVLDFRDLNLKEKIMELTNGVGVNVVYEAVGSQATYDLAFDLIAYGGKLMAFGLLETSLEIPFRKAFSKEIQFRWCQAGGTQTKKNKEIILRMMSKGLIDVNPLITSKIPMEKLVDGLESIKSGKQIRVIVEI